MTLLLPLSALCMIAAGNVWAASAGTLSLNLASDSADRALRKLAEQAGVEVVFSTDFAARVKTNPVRGDYAPLEAANRMLAGTPLQAVQKEADGAIVVSRRIPRPASDGSPPQKSAEAPKSAPKQSASPAPSPSTGTRSRVLSLLTLSLLGTTADAQTKAAAAEQETPVQLSPFEVVSDTKGYYGANTMSGTRLNSKIEDLAASITVVTKQQMQDFALLDINDLFSYEAGTEGTSNYTAVSFDRNGNNLIDNVAANPQGANRIRGVGPANITFGNFAGSGRVPIDPINIDAVEISRGPNANIFGIGSAAGSVNSVPASASLVRDKSQLTVRADDREGFRTTIDLGRVLRSGVLGVRGSAVYQRDGYMLKPSGTDTTRYNAMVKYRPFRATTLSASFTAYKMHGNRPNSITPVDGISAWKEAGSPTWDPVTFTAKLNGVPVGTYPNAISATTIPPFFNNLAAQNTSLIFVDQAGVGHWSTSRLTNTTSPLNGNQSMILMASSPTQLRLSQPLFSNNPTLTDRSVYDWMEINLAAPNYYEDHAKISTVSLEHLVIDNRRQRLAAQLSWYREANERWAINTISQSPYGDVGIGGIAVDVNERLLDGSPNPYFLRPFVASANPYLASEPRDQDIYRAQLAYKLDLRAEKSWLRWLGLHEVSGYTDYNYSISRRIRYRDSIVSDHAWMPAGIGRASTGVGYGGLAASPQLVRPYFRFYVGDNQGQNIDYAPTGYQTGNYTLLWGNGVTSQFNREAVALGSAVEGVGTGGNGNNKTILKSRGIILQSHLLKDRVITTFGVRRDERFSRNGAEVRYLPDGIHIDERTYNAWAPGDWAIGKGPTRTAGVVVRPLNWLRLHANRSDSFQPATAAVNIELKRLPDPTGKGEDYGFSVSLFGDKLLLRANQYTTSVLGSRNGTLTTLLNRAMVVDRPDVPGQTGAPPTYQLQTMAAGWATAAAAASGRTLTAAQLRTEVARIMALPESFLGPLEYQVSSSTDQIAKGREIEVNYNPTNYWTMKLNVTEQESIDANLGPEVPAWVAQRVAHWSTIIDPTINRPWYTERYSNRSSAAEFIATSVLAPLKLAQATEGKSRPQIRKYRANFSTNLRLSGLAEHWLFKRFNIGGALRWEDKASIGYYGVEELPAVITTLDPNRPIYDQARLYIDALVGYRTRLFSNKVSATFQLNVRNLTEDGRLQAVNAYPDGTPSVFRIIDRRQFILSASFDL